MNKNQVIRFNKQNIVTQRSPKGYGMSHVAKRDFKKGEKVMMGYGKLINHQTSHISVQVGLKKHYIPEKWTGRYWNHSCNPNTFVRTRANGFPDLIALRNIKKGEEITFNYAMTEYTWSPNAVEAMIPCLCKERNCRGRIVPFSELPASEQRSLIKKKMVSKYIQDAYRKTLK